MSGSKVLVVDADASVRNVLTEVLRREGAEVSAAGDGQAGLALLEKKSFDILFTPLGMPAKNGLTVLQQALCIRPDLCAVVLAGQGRLSSCVEAIRLGACDYLTKPFTPARIRQSLGRATACCRHKCGAAPAGEQLPSRPPPAAGMAEADEPVIAKSPAMAAVMAFVAKIAPTEVPVLIRGEAGTGRHLVARTIHRQSRRAGRALVVADCKGIPEAQLEARLFGHPQQNGPEAGPGPVGLLGSAQGGTLFLSDIECLPLWAQVRLFDAFHRVPVDHHHGGPRSMPLDVRLIASASCDLEAAVAEGRFYGGLYYLLNTNAVRVPPLRQRRAALKMLVEFFLRNTLAVQGIDRQGAPWSFSEEAWECLLNYDWPGNLPELAGVVAHAVAMAEGRRIDKDAVACAPHKLEARGAESISVVLSGNLHEIERHIIEEVVQRCGGNKAAAARALGLHRRTLYRMLEEGAGEPP